jgi:hypothetical protein
MTLERFFQLLASHARKFDWFVDTSGVIAGRNGERRFSPLTAVVYTERSLFIDEHAIGQAANILGLALDEAVLIDFAASRPDAGAPIDPDNCPRAVPVRKRLTEILIG